MRFNAAKKSDPRHFMFMQASLAALIMLSILAPALFAQSGSYSQLRMKVIDGEARALPQEDAAAAGFSYAVAVEGDLAVVGAAWHENSSGAAYVYERRGGVWVQTQVLRSDGAGRIPPAFGSAVAISDGRILIGAPWERQLEGAVYAFERDANGWAQKSKLKEPEPAVGRRFGAEVRSSDAGVDIAAEPAAGAGVVSRYGFAHAGEQWRVSADALQADAPSQVTYLDDSNLFQHIVRIETLNPVAAVDINVSANPVENFEATDGVFEQQVQLSWTPSPDQVLFYFIRRDDALIGAAATDDTLFSDFDGDPGRVYSYAITVFDVFQQEGAAATDEGSRIVFAPANLMASKGLFEDRVRLQWSDRSAIEDGFVIFRDQNEIARIAANELQYNDETAIAGTTHNYTVRAVHAFDGREFFSANAEFADPADTSGFRGTVLPPANVVASDGQYADSVVVTWEDQTDRETGYEILRDGTSIGQVDANVVRFVDSGAIPGTIHTYCVRSLMAASASVEICDTGGIGILPAPTRLLASDMTFDDRIRIGWSVGSALVDSVRLYRRARFAVDSTEIARLAAAITTFDDLGAVPDTVYVFSLVAYNNLGGRSVAVTDTGSQSLVLTPTGLTASQGEFEDRVELSWQSTSTKTKLFALYRDGQALKSVDRSIQAFTDFSAVAGVDHQYEVSAVSTGGNFVETGRIATTGKRELNAPSAVVASDGEFEDVVRVTWVDESKSEDGYKVFRYPPPGASDNRIFFFTLGPNRQSFVDTSAIPGLNYEYGVVAFDRVESGEGSSNEVREGGFRTLNAPTDVEATDGEFEQKIVVTWQDKSRAEDGYFVFRRAQGEPASSRVLVGRVGANTTRFQDSAGNLPGTFEIGAAYIYDVEAFSEVKVNITVSIGNSAPGSDAGFSTVLAPESFNASDNYPARIVLTWIDASVVNSGYRIMRDGQEIAQLDNSSATSYTDTDAVALDGRAHSYEIAAFLGSVASETREDQGSISGPGPSPGAEFMVRALTDKRLADAPLAEERFGFSVAIDGDRAIVGAPGPERSGLGPGNGAVYFYSRDEAGAWEQTFKIEGTQFLSKYGTSVAISGDHAMVGAPEEFNSFANARLGAVYFYKRRDGTETWELNTKVTASSAEGFNSFGISVAMQDGRAVIGAPGESVLVPVVAQGAGFIYFYTLQNGEWMTTPADRFTAVELRAGAGLGTSVALDGPYILAGAPNEIVEREPGLFFADGFAYVFKQNASGGWEQDAKLRPDERRDLALRFGHSVAISGNRAVIGEPGNRELSQNNSGKTGSAYVFEIGAGGWEQTAILSNSNPTRNDRSGWSVALAGDRIFVSTPIFGVPPFGFFDNTGAVTLFQYTDGQWQRLLRFESEGPVLRNTFGHGVAFSDGTLLAGAFSDDDGGNDAGAAYLFDLRGVAAVSASDGAFDDRVQVTWEDRADDEDEFRIYRDGQLIGTSPANTRSFDDLEAETGRAYEYGVAAFNRVLGEMEQDSDIGWRPPDGAINGRIATRAGAAVSDVGVSLDPAPGSALLFDGNGGRLQSPSLGLVSSNDLTVEMWVNPSQFGGTLFENDRFRLRMTSIGRVQILFLPSGSQVTTDSNDPGLSPGTWTHVAIALSLVSNGSSFTIDGGIIINDTKVKDIDISDIALSDVPGPAWRFGVDYAGRLDDIRIWQRGAADSSSRDLRGVRLTGSEVNLVGYFPLDEGMGLHSIELASNRNHASLLGGAHWTDGVDVLGVTAVSDAEGNYTFSGLRYGKGTTFRVTPSAGVRTFEPAFKTITLNPQSPVQNEVDFADVSAFTATGIITYKKDSNRSKDVCAVEGVEILVNGIVRGTTDRDGIFSVPVQPGTRSIRPRLAGHTFDADSVVLDVTQDVGGIRFTDTTLREISGRIAAGCPGLDIGTATLTFESENGCLVQSISRQGTFRLKLPPQKYTVELTDIANPPAGLDETQVEEFFRNLGQVEFDLTAADTTIDFIYRAPIRVEITGLEDFAPDQPVTFRGAPLPDDLFVMQQSDSAVLAIEVYEFYGFDANGEPQKCPVDTGLVTIFDEINDEEGVAQRRAISQGFAFDTTWANTPSLIIGRKVNGIDRSFQKSLVVRAEVSGQEPATAAAWVVVTGHRPREGASFVTASGTERIFYILRDPPGDNSFAFIEENTSVDRVIDYDLSNFRIAGTLSTEAKFGVRLSKGLGVSTESKAQVLANVSMSIGSNMTKESSTRVSLSFTESFSTSPEDGFIGGDGDVYIGAALNYIFAVVDVLDLDDSFELMRSESVAFQPDGFRTTYAFTESHIRNGVVPTLKKLRDDFVIEGATPFALDSLDVFIDVWEQDHLALNENLKQDAIRTRRFFESSLDRRVEQNISFSAGADYFFSVSRDTTSSFREEATLFVDDAGSLGFEGEESGTGLKILIGIEASVENTLSLTDTSATTGITTGFVLSDNDDGDNFTVNILQDNRFPTPIFEVLAGASSCPWEPWRDAEGKATLTPRDGPDISIALEQGDGFIADNVPPNAPAVFKLTLANDSQTRETRDYVLRQLQTSNADGAVLKVNGIPMGGGLPFTIVPDEPHSATLTVERGPTRFSYRDLQLILASPCDNAAADTTAGFGVEFTAPCADINLFSPRAGWLEDGDSLEVVLNRFDLGIADNDSVEYIGAEYRRLGSGGAGPGPWREIGRIERADLLDPDSDTGITKSAKLFLDIAARNLSDGVYEIRAFTHCGDLERRGRSTIAVGTINRNAPQVFAFEPADGLLSFGDVISVTFNEDIDCAAVRKRDNIELEKLLPNGEFEPLVDFDLVCDGRTIVATPVDFDAIEDMMVRLTVRGIVDRSGNPLGSEKTHLFAVRRQQFAWKQTRLTRDVPLGQAASFAATLVNGTNRTANFTLGGATFVVPFVLNGELPPLGEQDVAFTVIDGLAAGTYLDTILATAPNPLDPADPDTTSELILEINVGCQPPDWRVAVSSFTHSMTITAEVNILGVASTDTADMVAAFVGNELRGSTMIRRVTPTQALAFLTVYSNRTEFEQIRFEVFDASECRVFTSTVERFDFVADALLGTPTDPVVLNATDAAEATVQQIDLEAGWTWFSLNVDPPDQSLNAVLGSLTPAVGDEVKSQTSFATFADQEQGWVGPPDLRELGFTQSYMIRLKDDDLLVVDGEPIDLTANPITVADSGWTWIGYLPQASLPVDTALQNLSPALGSIIKGQQGFAVFAEQQTIGPPVWVGSLQTLEPGRGYRFYGNAESQGTTQFTYPQPSGNVQSLAKTLAKTGSAGPDSPDSAPDWSVDPRAYQYNMTVIASVIETGDLRAGSGDLVAAFVGDDCRGVTSAVWLESAQRYVFFLMTHSNAASNETVRLRYYNAATDADLSFEEVLTFSVDASVGSIANPIGLHPQGLATAVGSFDAVPAEFSLEQNYPNPFNPETRIRFALPVASEVRVEIFDISGRRVRLLQADELPPGIHALTWNARDDAGQRVGSGMYIYRLRARDFVDQKKMILMK